MSVETFYNILIDQKQSVGERTKAVFELKHLQTAEGVEALLKGFQYLGQSELLKHELVYTLGQLDTKFYNIVKDFLYKRVEDEKEMALVRHEAAEAIANYFDDESIKLYEKYQNSDVEYLAMTCQVALKKVKEGKKEKFGKDYAGTKEPIAPFTKEQFSIFLKNNNFEEVMNKEGPLGILTAPNVQLVDKYHILYHFRDLNTDLVKLALCKLLTKQHFKKNSALFKHQVCFAIGQIGLRNEEDEHLLRQCIENTDQENIVRHEALAALGSQSKDLKYLQKFNKDPDQIIRESAESGIFQIKYWNS